MHMQKTPICTSTTTSFIKKLWSGNPKHFSILTSFSGGLPLFSGGMSAKNVYNLVSAPIPVEKTAYAEDFREVYRANSIKIWLQILWDAFDFLPSHFLKRGDRHARFREIDITAK